MRSIFLFLALFFIAAGCNIFGIGSSGIAGVVKTLDGGGVWQLSNQIENSNANISGFSVTEMIFDPNNRQNIYVAGVNAGIWLSKNSGSSWKRLLSKMAVYDIYIDQFNSDNIYAAGVFENHGKIVRSKDGGRTWEALYNEASLNNAVDSITANPSNNREVYAGLGSGALIKSLDGGVNWSVAYNFKDQILKVRYNRLNSGIYVLLRTKGLAKSADFGAKWTFLTTSLTQSQSFDGLNLLANAISSFSKVSLDDQVPGVIYISTSKGLYKTIDDGKNWLFLNVPVQNKDGDMPRAVTSSKGGTLVYTSIGSTILKTLDGGQSWQTQELPTTNLVNKILIDPVTPQTVYAGLFAR